MENENGLYQAIIDSFHKVTPVETWAAKTAECKIVKDMVTKIEKLAPDTQEQTARAMMVYFFNMRKSGDKFWNDTPFTPRGMISKWDRIVDALSKRATAEANDPGDIEDMENPDALDLIESLQLVYERDYPAALKRRMLRSVGNRPRRYILAMHAEILREFKASSTRPLPDVATINDAIKELGPASTYVEPVKTKALPSPDKSKQYRDKIEQMIHNIDGVLDDAREDQRKSMRAKVAAGHASRWESHWLWCMDENGGQYIPPEVGPYATEFVRHNRDLDGNVQANQPS